MNALASLIAESLLFFLPALAANQCPGLTAKLNLPGNRPISRYWLGENKTWHAFYTAALGSLLVIYAERWFIPNNWALFDYNRRDLWLVGLAFGIGAVLGDHTKSFLKRRIGLKPGEPWWPFDQLDFVVGSLVVAMPLTGWIGIGRVLAISTVVLAIHPIGNRVSYRLGLRRVPW